MRAAGGSGGGGKCPDLGPTSLTGRRLSRSRLPRELRAAWRRSEPAGSLSHPRLSRRHFATLQSASTATTKPTEASRSVAPHLLTKGRPASPSATTPPTRSKDMLDFRPCRVLEWRSWCNQTIASGGGASC